MNFPIFSWITWTWAWYGDMIPMLTFFLVPLISVTSKWSQKNPINQMLCQKLLIFLSTNLWKGSPDYICWK
jgi:hypothetical protein